MDSLFARARAMLDDRGASVSIAVDTTFASPSLVQSFRSQTGDLVRHTANRCSR